MKCNRIKAVKLIVHLLIVKMGTPIVPQQVSEMRRALEGPSSKRAANTIKKLIADLDLSESTLEDIPLELSCPSFLEGGFGRKDAKGFLDWWTNYFVIFDILDEKQSHIIKPVLKDKLSVIEKVILKSMDKIAENKGLSETIHSTALAETCQWYFAILGKIISHDNRAITRGGFVKLINLGEHKAIKSCLTLQELVRDMFLQKVFPIIREQVGWILPKPSEFFDVASRFGICLRNVYETHSEEVTQSEIDMIVITKVLSHLMRDGVIGSPAAVLFFVDGLRSAVTSKPFERFSSREVDNWSPSIDDALMLMNNLLVQGMTTVDTFFLPRIEKTLMNILMTRILPLTKYSSDKLDFSDSVFNRTMSILGAVSFRVFTQELQCDKSGDLKVLNSVCLNSVLESDSESLTKNLRCFNPMQMAGFTRAVICSSETEDSKVSLFNTIWKCLQDSIVASSDYELLVAVSQEFTNCFNGMKGPKDLIFEQYHSCKERAINTFLSASQSKGKHNDWRVCQVDALRLQTWFKILRKRKIENITNCSTPIEQKFYEHLVKVGIQNATENYFFWRIVRNFVLSDPTIMSGAVLSTVLRTFSIMEFKDFEPLAFCMPVTMASYFQNTFKGFAHFLKMLTKKFDWDFLQTFPECGLWKMTLKAVSDNVDRGGIGGVTSATKYINSTLSFLLQHHPKTFRELQDDNDVNEGMEHYVRISWNLCFEMRKSEKFWDALEQFCILIANPFFSGKGILQEFATKLFNDCETVVGIPLNLIRNILLSVETYWEEILFKKDRNALEEIVDIALHASFFGFPLPKQLRVQFTLWGHIKEMDKPQLSEEVENCVFIKASATRLTAIVILQHTIMKGQ